MIQPPGRQTWAVVPLRGLESAKTRLAAALDAEERLDLVVEMATRTLVAARDADRIAGTVLVTADPAAAVLARSLGARAIVQVLPGLNTALGEGRAEAVRAGATAILVVPIDLPAVGAAALDALLADIDATRSLDPDAAVVAVVPDRHRLGTNALFIAPAAVIDPAFGDGSFTAHRAAAIAVGARFLEFGGPLTLDLDTSEDLLVAESGEASPRAAGTLGTLDGGHAA